MLVISCVMVRRVFTEDQEAKLKNYLRHACTIYFVSIRPHPKTGPRKETHTKRKKKKATVWTHTPEKNLVGRQEHEREKLRKALIPKKKGQHVKNRNKQTEGNDTFCLVCLEQRRKDGKEWECKPCNAYHATNGHTLVFNVSPR